MSLRSDRKVSRRVATIFCRENAKYLQERGQPTFAHLRLAFLLGAADAARVLQAQQHTPIADLLSSSVVNANPFMSTMSLADLLEKSERDMSEHRPVPAAVASSERPPARVRPSLVRRIAEERSGGDCGAKRASCRKVSALTRTVIKGRKG